MKNSLWTNEHYVATVLIIIGGGFLLQQMGIIDFGWLLGKIWPVFIIGYGFLLLAQKPAQRTAALATIAIGTILTVSSLNALQFNVWALFWPLILIGIGILILKRNRVQPAYSEDQYNANITMSEDKRTITSQKFEGGQVSVWMGGSKLDLTKAKLADNALLTIQIVMGEMKIEVPANTKIINQTSQIMAESKDRTRPTEKSKQTLTITGSIFMGSLEVTD